MMLSVVVLLFMIPSLLSAKSIFKRDVCKNGTYETNGAVFDTSCGVFWGGHDLQVVFTVDFTSCLEQCAMWNTVNPQQCVGVVFGRSKPGPVKGTLTCYLKWKMPGNAIGSSELDSGQLQGVILTDVLSHGTRLTF